MLDLRDLGLEGVERLCHAGELIPLDNGSRAEREMCIISVRS